MKIIVATDEGEELGTIDTTSGLPYDEEIRDSGMAAVHHKIVKVFASELTGLLVMAGAE